MPRVQLSYIKNNLVVFSTIVFFVCHFFLVTNSAVAADSLSYSGRLVQTNGAPVSGPVDLLIELAYATSTTAGTVVCSQNFSSVALSNGVFHLKLNLCPGTLADVLAQVPDGKYAAIRVTNLSATPDKVYDFQELNSMPFANIAGTAKQLVQMTAVKGQVLEWDGAKWWPTTLGAGTLTGVTSGGLPIIVSGGTAPVISIEQASGSKSGYLSADDWNMFNTKQSITAGLSNQYYRGDKTWQTLKTDAVPEAGSLTNLYFTNARALGVPLDGFVATPSASTIVASDSILAAFGKTQGQIDTLTTAGSAYLKKNSATGESITGVVNVGTIGSLNLTYTPTNATDATNKSYVDSKVSDSAALKLNKAGDSMAGALTLNSDLIIKNGTHTVTISGDPAATATYSLTLPPAAGAAGNVLKTDAAGKLSWADLSSVAPTTNANMTGPITSVGNTTSVASQTGTGSTFVMSASPTITTPTFSGIATGSISGNAATVTTNANLTGDVTSVGNATTIGTSGTRDATTYLAGDNTWRVFADNVFAAPLPALSTAGINHGNQTIAATDSINVAFNKLLFAQGDYISKTATSTVNGTLAINGLTGNLVVPDAPFGINSAVNQTYVQAALSELDGRKQNTSTLGADVQAVLLSGLTAATNAVITAADSIVLAFGKLQNQISNKANTTDVSQTITAAKITGLSGVPTGSDATSISYVQSNFVASGGGTMTGALVNNTSNASTAIAVTQSGTGYAATFNGGNVGIGTNTPVAKLDVEGEVKFGNTSSACNPASEGQQRYNSTIKKMEYCNGTNWRIFTDDIIPDSFSFTNQTGVSTTSTITSNLVTLSGFDGPLSATCSGCTLERNSSGSFASNVNGFMSGDTIRLRQTSSSSSLTATTVSVSIGGTSSSWQVTTYYDLAVNTILTFQNCNQAGGTSPSQTQCNSFYSTTNLAGQVTVTGNLQSWTVPVTGTYEIEAKGSAGGGTGVYAGGNGGTAFGRKALTAGTILYLAVGNKGEDTISSVGDTVTRVGGFNGGGNSCPDTNTPQGSCAAGGGASDVRVGGTALSNRIIVGAGGGGACGGGTNNSGGAGGGLTGSNGITYGDVSYAGKGGTQTEGGAATNTSHGGGQAGSLGQGGHGATSCTAGGAGGGGGGYYGGSAGGGGYEGSGGGGSSYYGGLDSNQSTTPNANTGNGVIYIKRVL